jgi:hypothetical protein
VQEFLSETFKEQRRESMFSSNYLQNGNLSQSSLPDHPPGGQISNEGDDKSRKDNKSRKVDLQPKRMSISLPIDTTRVLEAIAELQGISQNEAIRRAIATEAFIQGEVARGSKVLIKMETGDIKEVVFR